MVLLPLVVAAVALAALVHSTARARAAVGAALAALAVVHTDQRRALALVRLEADRARTLQAGRDTDHA